MKPKSIKEVQEIVQSQARLLPRGGGSKPALSTPLAEVTTLEMSGLAGVLEYEPGEFTFTALAGTPVADVATQLAKHGQYMPFDPLLAQKGATLGGVVAADTSGSGRYRFGGARDFLIGARFVDGKGRLVRGGGKVVKNAAGFDLPKLMVGSLGRLGALVELSFKVFPAPETYSTLQVEFSRLGEAVEAMQRLTTSSLEMDALDLEPPGRLWIRVGGLAEALPNRLKRLEKFLRDAPDSGVKSAERIEGKAEQQLWQKVNALEWVPAGWSLVKVPLTLGRIPLLEKNINGHSAQRRYSVGGNVAWVAWPGAETNGDNDDAANFVNTLDTILTRIDLAGLVILGSPGQIFLGLRAGQALAQRVKQALDPTHRFLEV